MIPRVIHRSWYTKTLPEPVQIRFREMMSRNPGYEHILHLDQDMHDFVHGNFNEEISKTYDSLDIIVAKVDFWRYLKLFHEGGIYLDMDSLILDPIETFIKPDDQAVISAENNPEKFVQWALFFEKGHPILERTIQYIVRNVRDGKFQNDILNLTGPGVYSRAIHDLYRESTGKTINDGKHVDDSYTETFQIHGMQCRIFGVDYQGHCTFKYLESDFLYKERKHWREEQAEKLAREPVGLVERCKRMIRRLRGST